MNGTAELLDRVIPLRGASHADVVCYAVDVPMRYTECCAILSDGRIARLRDTRQFMGWSATRTTMELLFTGADRHVEIALERSGAPRVRDVTCWRISDKRPNGNARYFVARDGSRFAIELAERMSTLPPQHRRHAPVLDPYPEWRACRNRAASTVT